MENNNSENERNRDDLGSKGGSWTSFGYNKDLCTTFVTVETVSTNVNGGEDLRLDFVDASRK